MAGGPAEGFAGLLPEVTDEVRGGSRGRQWVGLPGPQVHVVGKASGFWAVTLGSGAAAARGRAGRARSKPVLDDEMSAADKPQQVTVVYRKPVVRPGTPETRGRRCLCRFESNMQAGCLTAERGCEDEVIVVIHKDCPLHKFVRKPVDDVLGDQ